MPAPLDRRTLVLGVATAAGATALGQTTAQAAAQPATQATSQTTAQAAPAAARADRGRYSESTVFTAGEAGLEVFHVFGLTVTRRGTVLAFAEGRITQHDADPHHLVCRRSTDGGRSWGELRYVRRSDGTQSFINPTPLLDGDTGRLFLFYAECFRDEGNTGGSPDRSRLYVIDSEDEGRSWSEPTELTSLFDGNPHAWTLHMPGPGHGIRLDDGRLILQTWHRRAIAYPVAERRYGVSVVHSDDHGRTWHHGGAVPLDGAYPVNESRLLQRPDGSLALLGRYASGGTHPRIVSVSGDRGATWSTPVLDAAVRPVNAVDTGIARISGGPGGAGETSGGGHGTSRVVFTRPDSTQRRNLTISLSYDEGMTWPHSRVITEGPASYSDAIALPDGRVGVLFGRDHAEGVSTSFSGKVAFATLDLEWLTSEHHGSRTPSGYDVDALPLTTGGDATVEVVEDPHAAGGRRAELAGTDYGAYLEVTIDVPRGDTYDVYARFRHLPGGGTVAVTIDGEGVGGPLDTSTLDVRSFKTEHLGRIRLHGGRRRVRFTVVDKHVNATALRLSPDLITLAPS
ncbi:exo-alpha-sialidase [Streptomyces sp. SBT349]|uniref:exo-alpha-sialidase n=1 Tax=Streptomyces sp. SBT349 TaxID=1580539 RepID=UPI00066E43A4|nr:exo-alpha-sialidase [Streptomyces sp. SBT349]